MLNSPGIKQKLEVIFSLTADVLAELMTQVPDVLAKISAEKGGIDRINSIATIDLTFTNSNDYLQIFNITSNDLKAL
jgi:hypothetical protein